MSVLFFHAMRYKPSDPGHPSNDRFVLSKVRGGGMVFSFLFVKDGSPFVADETSVFQSLQTLIPIPQLRVLVVFSILH